MSRSPPSLKAAWIPTASRQLAEEVDRHVAYHTVHLYTMAMSRVNLTREQARKLLEQMQPMCSYLYRVRERLQQLGFDEEDSLFRTTHAAYRAVQELTCEAHSESCKGQMG